MPEMWGRELVDQLRRRGDPLTYVVFVTAHDEHAVAAFEKQAVDCVLKPFSKERVGEALGRASRMAAGERAQKLIAALPQLKKLAHPQYSKIAIKAQGRILFISPSDIIAVQAEGNYVLLQQDSGSYLLREAISETAEKLKPYGFIRIHRSVLVNSAHVEEIKPYPTGEYGLRVKSGKEYTVTRTYRKNLKSLAEFWIGTDTFLSD